MAGSSPRAEGPEDTAMRVVLSSALGSSGDRSGTTPGEIVAPQRDGKGDDGEPGYNDRKLTRIPASCAREETPESRGMPCLFLNTERGFGGKPPQKSGFRRHLAGSKMP